MSDEISFKDAIKHLSDKYMDTTHDCEICKKIIEILDEYDMTLPKKEWDYDI